MTTTLSISFPWGGYHGTPWGRHVNEAAIEWPPSPWRILRALYATYKCQLPHLDTELVYSLLNNLTSPPSYSVPQFAEANSRHYMPDISSGTDKVIDAFAVFERGTELAVIWNVDLASDELTALKEIALQLPYMGRAESICESRVLPPGAGLPDGTKLVPAGSASAGPGIRVLVPDAPLDLKALTVRTTEVRKERFVVPPGTYWLAYDRPEMADETPTIRRPASRRPTAIRFEVVAAAKPSIKAALTMTDVMRQACLSRFGKLNDGGVSAVLAGKTGAGVPVVGHMHAHYIALDNDDDRLIDTFVIWAPGGLPPQEVAAIATLSHLRGYSHVSDFRECQLGLVGAGRMEDVAPELVGPSSEWISATPFAPSRYGRRRTDWDDHIKAEVRRELGYRELPVPEQISLVRGDWPGYRRHRPSKQRLQDARRAAGLSLTFREPVAGPLVLGALSHFGLGVFVPNQ